MEVIKGGSKVKSVPCDHSRGYTQEGPFDAARRFGVCRVRDVTDGADRGNTYVQRAQRPL